MNKSHAFKSCFVLAALSASLATSLAASATPFECQIFVSQQYSGIFEGKPIGKLMILNKVKVEDNGDVVKGIDDNGLEWSVAIQNRKAIQTKESVRWVTVFSREPRIVLNAAASLESSYIYASFSTNQYSDTGLQPSVTCKKLDEAATSVHL